MPTEKEAITVADIVVLKIRKDIIPPSVSIVELDSIGVINMQNLDIYTVELDSFPLTPAVFLDGWGYDIRMDDWIYIVKRSVLGRNPDKRYMEFIHLRLFLFLTFLP